MRPTFLPAFETTRLVEFFKSLAYNKPISFDAASKSVGFRVSAQSSAYNSARRIAERDHGVVVVSVRNFGFQRADGEAMAQSGDGFLKSIRRKSKKGATRMGLALTHNLSKDEQTRTQERFARFNILHSTSERVAPASNRRIQEEPPK